MFCPQCGTKNIEGASFCRTCGVDISLVPQAMTGQLPVVADSGQSAIEKGGHRRRGGKNSSPPDISKAIENFILGIGFIFVALSVWRFMPGGFVWWFWMLIPAFALIGSSVAQYVRVKQTTALNSPPASAVNSLPPVARNELPPPPLSSPDTAEIVAPPLSVTEATTRHLAAEPQRKKQ